MSARQAVPSPGDILEQWVAALTALPQIVLDGRAGYGATEQFLHASMNLHEPEVRVSLAQDLNDGIANNAEASAAV